MADDECENCNDCNFSALDQFCNGEYPGLCTRETDPRKECFQIDRAFLNSRHIVVCVSYSISVILIFIGAMIGYTNYKKNKSKKARKQHLRNLVEANALYPEVRQSYVSRSGENMSVGNDSSHIGQARAVSAYGDKDSLYSLGISRDGSLLNSQGESPLYPITNYPDLFYCANASDIVLHKKLGEGFYGKVLSARWKGNWVAVKILKHQQLAEVEQEVRTLIRLRHPNVLPFYGCTPPPEQYIITELLWGSLFGLLHDDKALKRGGETERRESSSSERRGVQRPLSELVLFRIVTDIANGLSYIHESNIIHRDVSTSNVLVTGSREKLEELAKRDGLNAPAFAKITDFGLSRDIRVGQTSSAVNLSYLSPEGYRGELITTQSDVFSFAIVVWEAYMCERPYLDQPNEQIAAYRVTCEKLRPEITPKIPKGISVLMQDCWVDDPVARPTMSAAVVFLQELQGLWSQHNEGGCAQTDGNESDKNDKWDGVAVKPAVVTYSTFDADETHSNYTSRSDSGHYSFRIGDIQEDDDDSDIDQDKSDASLQISLTSDSEKRVYPEHPTPHPIQHSVSSTSQSLHSVKRIADPTLSTTTYQDLSSHTPTEEPSFIHDVYHELVDSSSFRYSASSSPPLKEEKVDEEPRVPPGGEK